jgi:putative transposase
VPRRPRLQLADGVFHVFARGVRKEPLFQDNEDRQYNERHGLEGHVFERRFQSVLVEGESHLLELLRYVVLVRAGLRPEPAGWYWSSYRATAGLGRAPRFLARERVLRLFRGRGGTAEEHYERFVVPATEHVIV